MNFSNLFCIVGQVLVTPAFFTFFIFCSVRPSFKQIYYSNFNPSYIYSFAHGDMCNNFYLYPKAVKMKRFLVLLGKTVCQRLMPFNAHCYVDFRQLYTSLASLNSKGSPMIHFVLPGNQSLLQSLQHQNETNQGTQKLIKQK